MKAGVESFLNTNACNFRKILRVNPGHVLYFDSQNYKHVWVYLYYGMKEKCICNILEYLDAKAISSKI